MIFLSSADFFFSKLTFSKNSTSECQCQRVWINILSSLTRIQTVCKDASHCHLLLILADSSFKMLAIISILKKRLNSK